MIICFTGKTGSGKTLQMVKLAYRRWLRGTDVYSNTVLFFEKYGGPENSIQQTWYGRKIRRGKIRYFTDITEILEVRDGIILFDEAQVLFNARQWESLPAEFQYKLQQHRKHNLDLYCTTQNMKAIDIVYRRLVQHWFHCRRLWGLGERPCWFGVFRTEQKDVDMLYNDVDDLTVEVLNYTIWLLSPLWTKRKYDTFFDIGFKRFKTIWATSFDGDQQMKRLSRWYIIPKNLSLQDASRVISSYRSASGLIRSQTSKTA